MNHGSKLADLKALANSAVAEESSKASSLLRTPALTEAVSRNGPQGEEKTTRAEGKTKSAPKAIPITRVPTVLRGIDMKAISAAKIYLMQSGRAGVSTNNVIQVALRSMKIGPELLKLLEGVLAEDGRRK